MKSIISFLIVLYLTSVNCYATTEEDLSICKTLVRKNPDVREFTEEMRLDGSVLTIKFTPKLVGTFRLNGMTGGNIIKDRYISSIAQGIKPIGIIAVREDALAYIMVTIKGAHRKDGKVFCNTSFSFLRILMKQQNSSSPAQTRL